MANVSGNLDNKGRSFPVDSYEQYIILHCVALFFTHSYFYWYRSYTFLLSFVAQVVHLIGLALHEQKAAYENNEPFEFLAKATKGIPNLFLFFVM